VIFSANHAAEDRGPIVRYKRLGVKYYVAMRLCMIRQGMFGQPFLFLVVSVPRLLELGEMHLQG
jgi:hypothetical protein